MIVTYTTERIIYCHTNAVLQIFIGTLHLPFLVGPSPLRIAIHATELYLLLLLLLLLLTANGFIPGDTALQCKPGQ